MNTLRYVARMHLFFMAHRHDMGRDTTVSRFCGWCKFMWLSVRDYVRYAWVREQEAAKCR